MRSLVKFVAFVLCVALCDAKRDFRCDYKYFPEADGWLKLHEIPTNWHDARLRCQLEGATLASPITAGIGKAMMTLKNKYVNTTASTEKNNVHLSVYTGIHATYSIKDYASIEGIPLSDIQYKWRPGSPYMDLVGDSDCLVMGPTGELFGVDGEEAEYPFLCYKKFEKMEINACGTVDDGYLKWDSNDGKGNCYKYHGAARPWRDAYKTCAAEGGYLAVVNSGEEADFLKQIINKFRVDSKAKPHRDHGHESYDSEDDDPEEGSFENILGVGFTRSEVSKWMPLTIHGQTLLDAGYARLGQKHKDKDGRCGAIDDKGYLVYIGCNKIWYRFVCERRPGKIQCGNSD